MSYDFEEKKTHTPLHFSKILSINKAVVKYSLYIVLYIICDLFYKRLSGSTYAGLHEVSGFEVDCWQQGRAPPPYTPTTPFLTYCSRKTEEREPVRWVFYDGSSVNTYTIYAKKNKKVQ